MKRYQKLIIDAVAGPNAGNSASHSPAKKNGYAVLSRETGAPTSSIHEWATYPLKVPAYKSLEKLSAFFKVPLPTLLMEVGEVRSPEDDIIDALYGLTEEQKVQVVEYINGLRQCQ